jgi:hypothetical protein
MATAMAKDAGPNPTQIRSCNSSSGVYRKFDRFSNAGKALSSRLLVKPANALWTAGVGLSDELGETSAWGLIVLVGY